MSKSKDVVVVGGGINGVSIAYHLAQNGAKVTLLEKSHIAGGPSGLSSAIVRQHYSNVVTARMALESLRVWQNFTEVIGGEPIFTQTGILIGVRPEDVEGLKANIALQQSVGINTHYVQAGKLRDLEPHLNAAGLGGAVYEPEAGYCDPVEATMGFAVAAKRHGAQIQTGTRVTGIRIRNGKLIGAETDQGFVAAGAVVIAAGPWSASLLKRIGIELPMIIARVKVGIYRRPEEFDRHMIWGDFITQIYLRPETGNMMLVGSISPEEETGDQVNDPDNFNEKVGLDILSDFAERVARRYPVMENGHLASNFASLYDITPDWHHVMDAAPGVDGLYICAGTSGHGFKLAPVVGKMMAKLVLQGKQAEDDINLFSWDRFARGNPVRGQYEYSILG